MIPVLRENFGNPSSIHALGQAARAAVDSAREKVAALIGASPSEIAFTSGGTEANNIAIFGTAVPASRETGRNHIVTSAIEHHSVFDACHVLEGRCFQVTYLPVDRLARVDPEQVRKAITDRTCLVSIMFANNEVGTIQPVAEIAAICVERGVPFHTDAVQGAGNVPLDVSKLPVQMLSLSGHKFYGPKGAGALFVRSGVRLEALVHGGGQERGIRPGTENVPGIVGLGEAAAVAAREVPQRLAHVSALRDRLIREIPRRVPQASLTGDPRNRLPGLASFHIEGVEGESLLVALDLEGIAASSGSACALGALESSHVLRAMGFSDSQARGHLRLSLGRKNTNEELDRLLEVLPPVVDRLRRLSAST